MGLASEEAKVAQLIWVRERLNLGTRIWVLILCVLFQALPAKSFPAYLVERYLGGTYSLGFYEKEEVLLAHVAAFSRDGVKGSAFPVLTDTVILGEGLADTVIPADSVTLREADSLLQDSVRSDRAALLHRMGSEGGDTVRDFSALLQDSVRFSPDTLFRFPLTDSVLDPVEFTLRREGSSDSLLLTPVEADGNMLSENRLPLGVRWRHFCDSLSPTAVAFSAMLLPGFGQIMNRDYWKLPVFYVGMGGFATLGAYSVKRYNELSLRPDPVGLNERYALDSERYWWKSASYAAFGACAATYALSVADALISRSPGYQSPTAALFSSLLLPGLGQLYNRAYWKIPIIYATSFWLVTQLVHTHQQYKRFEQGLVYLLDEDPMTVDEFGGRRTQREIEYYMDYYQRYRDLSAIGLALLYFLNVVDAYVDAHLFYWNVDENLALRAYPEVHPLYLDRNSTMAMTMNVQFDF